MDKSLPKASAPAIGIGKKMQFQMSYRKANKRFPR